MPDPHPVARTWRDIRELLDATELELEPLVRRSDQVVFDTLARAEASVHGIEIDEVHFHGSARSTTSPAAAPPRTTSAST